MVPPAAGEPSAFLTCIANERRATFEERGSVMSIDTVGSVISLLPQVVTCKLARGAADAKRPLPPGASRYHRSTYVVERMVPSHPGLDCRLCRRHLAGLAAGGAEQSAPERRRYFDAY